MSRVLALVSTIPARRKSCERLLAELYHQQRRPDGVVLILDGYGDAPAPACALTVVLEKRTTAPVGAGARWKVATELLPDDILVCVDDDTMLVEAAGFIKSLAKTIEDGAAAAASMGRSANGKFAPPGMFSRGELIYGAGCGLTVRAQSLVGIEAFAAQIQSAGGPDALGVLGDDDALVSAWLFKQGIKIMHAKTGNIYAASGTRSTSQTAAKLAKKVPMDAQKEAIAKLTGWPWKASFIPKPGVR